MHFYSHIFGASNSGPAFCNLDNWSFSFPFCIFPSCVFCIPLVQWIRNVWRWTVQKW